MSSRYASRAADVSGPAVRAFTVTPHASDNLEEPARSLYVGTGGNVQLITGAGEDVTFFNVPGGTILPVWCRAVRAASTTASNIVALV